MRATAAVALLALATLVAPSLALANHDNGSGGRSLGGATLPQAIPLLRHVEAEDFDARDAGVLIADAGATGGLAWRLDHYSNISVRVDVPTPGIVWLNVRARGEHPPGLLTTHLHPVIDGQQRGEWDVGPNWTTYHQSLPLTAGGHAFTIENFNNYHAPAADRTLVIDWIELSVPFLDGAPHAASNLSAFVDGPQIHEAGTGVARTQDPGGFGSLTSWQMWGIGCFVEEIVADDAGSYHWSARLRGDEPGGVGSHTTFLADARAIMTASVGENWTNTSTILDLARRPHILSICYDNDYGGAQKRNLWLDEMRLAPVHVAPPPPPPPTNVTDTTTNVTTTNATDPAAPPTLPTPAARAPAPQASVAIAPPSPGSGSRAMPLAPWLCIAAGCLAAALRTRKG